MRLLKILLLAIILPLCVVCVQLPIIGANGYFADFRIPYSKSEHLQLLVNHLVGPIFIALVTVTLMVLELAKKRLAWWIPSFGIIGALYTARIAGLHSHDFSHVVFEECSGIYGTFLGWISAGIILAFIGICLVDRSTQRRKPARVWTG